MKYLFIGIIIFFFACNGSTNRHSSVKTFILNEDVTKSDYYQYLKFIRTHDRDENLYIFNYQGNQIKTVFEHVPEEILLMTCGKELQIIEVNFSFEEYIFPIVLEKLKGKYGDETLKEIEYQSMCRSCDFTNNYSRYFGYRWELLNGEKVELIKYYYIKKVITTFRLQSSEYGYNCEKRIDLDNKTVDM